MKMSVVCFHPNLDTPFPLCLDGSFYLKKLIVKHAVVATMNCNTVLAIS
jgi:hypothetical protein